ncbi:MAG: hypothetical protein DMG06_18585 [Acidobacteria bacterium]|nr:MAG: hypothetical protein DMG06_18585 [Acidobacteriota bacterium]
MCLGFAVWFELFHLFSKVLQVEAQGFELGGEGLGVGQAVELFEQKRVLACLKGVVFAPGVWFHA